MADGFSSIFDIKRANEASGRNWFSEEKSERDGALVETEVIGGFFYVESVLTGDPDGGREYRAVRASTDGAVRYLTPGLFGSVAAARALIDTELSS